MTEETNSLSPVLLVITPVSTETGSLHDQLASAGFQMALASDMRAAMGLANEQAFLGVVVGPEAVRDLEYTSLRTFTDRFPKIPVVLCTSSLPPGSGEEVGELASVLQVEESVDSNGFVEALLHALRPEVQEQHRRELYERHVDRARELIESRDTQRAHVEARRAIALDESRPEAFNLMGAILHLQHKKGEAMRFLRISFALDPTYEPAKHNLESVGRSHSKQSGIDLG